MKTKGWVGLTLLGLAVLLAAGGGSFLDLAPVAGRGFLALNSSSSVAPLHEGEVSMAHLFQGTARQDGVPAAEGTSIVGLIGGTLCGRSTVESGGAYTLEVVSTATIPGCGTAGATVNFRVGGYPAGSAAWQAGAVSYVELVAQGGAGLGSEPSRAGPSGLAGAEPALTGVLHIIDGDPRDPALGARRVYLLIDDAGVATQLEVTPSIAGQLEAQRLDRQRVAVRGETLQPARVRVTSVALEEAPALSAGLAPTVSGSQRWATLLCRFGDVPSTPHPTNWYATLMGAAYPGLDHYWRELSFNQINLNGSSVAGWYNLPRPRSAYFDAEGNLNHGLVAQDCAGAADGDVFFPTYGGINLLFNDMLGCCAWGGSWTLNLDGQTKTYSTTWMPPWGWENQSVMGHEMGHGFGLPHSSGPYGQTYDSAWDVMSNTWYCAVTDPQYGCVGQHTIAYHKDVLGWIPALRTFVPAVGSVTSITLHPLSGPIPGSGYLQARIPARGSSSRFYTVEARSFRGYDENLPGEAVIIHQVDTLRGRPAQVVDADGNGNPNDAGAMWLPGETFWDVRHGIQVRVGGQRPDGGFYVTVTYPTQSPPTPSISGTVTDSSGAPVAGATVLAQPYDETGSPNTNVTGADGTYTIGDLAPGDYWVEACAAGYICEYWDDRLSYGDADPVPATEGANTSNINFSLRAEGTISGLVTDAGGSPIPDAWLNACPVAAGYCSSASTGPDGTYTIGGLATGEYRVNACATGYVCEYWDDHVAYDEADPVPVTEGVETSGINFSLRAEGTISGLVTDAGGSPIPDAWLNACPVAAGYCSYASTGPDGTYTIGGLATGEYRVNACATGYVCEYWDDHVAWEDADPVSVTEGVDTSGVNFSLRVGGTISGVVTEAGGNPIAECWVYASPYAGSGASGGGYTGSDGTYTIAGLATGSYRVEVQCTGYFSEYWDDHAAWEDADPVAVTEGADTPNINFSLSLGGTISGVVTDAAGEPIEGADVSASPYTGDGTYGWATTGPDGSYSIGGLATGEYRVDACATGYVCEYWDDHVAYDDADAVPVTEGANTSNINFSLRVEGSISGVVTDGGGSPIQGCWVSASPYSDSGTWGSGQTAADGTYTIGGLAAGSYRVRAGAWDSCAGYVPEYWDDHLAYQDADLVTVAEGVETSGISFSLRVGGTISGVVSDADGGPIEGCWVSASPYTGSGASAGDYTGPDGAYTTTALPTGSYRLWASCTGYIGEYWDDHAFYGDADPVPVTEGMNTPDVNFSLRVGGSISGVVTDGGGSPIEGCWLYASPYTGSGASGGAYTEWDGTYIIAGLATGSYRVEAQCAGYFSEYWDDHVAYEDADPVAVTEGADTPNINFSLSLGGTISGVVTDAAGEPIEGADVSASPYTGDGTYGWATTGPDGSYSIGGLATGEYRVDACATGYVCEYWDDHVAWEDADPVAVAEGDDIPNVNFSLGVGGTISGTVTDAGDSPIAGAWLSACPLTGGDCGSATAAADGTYTIDFLAGGSYRVQACAAGYICENYDDHLTWWFDSDPAADPVQVTEGANTPDINFSLHVEGTISGAITDLLGSPITGAFVAVVAWPLTSQATGGFAFPGPDGTYTIGGLATGSYRVKACASGYACEYWDDRPSEQTGDPVGATEGSNTPGIDFALEMDPDNDGVRNDVDNCPSLANSAQENADAVFDNGPGIPGDDTTIPNATADGEGDACETDGDADNDGLPDAEDTNPLGATGLCAAFAGSSDGHPHPAGGDVTNDDDHDGDAAAGTGTDASDNGPSWDTDNDGALDGYECAHGSNPRDRGSKPAGLPDDNADSDGDGLWNGWERRGWGTNPNMVDSDGDGRGDCKEAGDVNGDGLVMLTDLMFYAKAALRPAASFGKTMDFDLNKDGVVGFTGDVVPEAKLALIAGLCK